MEKKISLTRTEVIKWIIFLATVLSTFFALQYRVTNLSQENEDRKRENLELRDEIKDLKFQINETGKQVSTVNAKLDEIKTTVNNIADAIFNNQLNPHGKTDR